MQLSSGEFRVCSKHQPELGRYQQMIFVKYTTDGPIVSHGFDLLTQRRPFTVGFGYQDSGMCHGKNARNSMHPIAFGEGLLAMGQPSSNNGHHVLLSAHRQYLERKKEPNENRTRLRRGTVSETSCACACAKVLNPLSTTINVVWLCT
jgi:hypothetical protein